MEENLNFTPANTPPPASSPEVPLRPSLSQPLPPSSIKPASSLRKFLVIGVLCFFVLTGAILGFFYFQKKLELAVVPSPSPSASAKIGLTLPLPSPSPSPISETGDPVFDYYLKGIDEGLNQLAKDEEEARQGLNDQQIEILEGI